MNMWFGGTKLIISFLIVVSISLWMIIKYNRMPLIVKICLITFSIWYGIVLYYSTEGMKGWPTCQQIPDMSFVKDAFIIEPTSENLGGIYFWLIYPGSKIPRAHRLPYSKEQHENTTKMKKKVEKGYGLLFYGSKEKKIKFIDPSGNLPKEKKK